MGVGFIMLCDTAFDRAAQVARHWAERGCPVVIHVDARVHRHGFARMQRLVAGVPGIRFSDRHRCQWGSWGLVAATLSAAEVMLRDFPQVNHVYLASGSCLPLRPVPELVRYLADRPRTDFIESVTTEDVGWTVGGLDIERFTLRFPFSWRRNRKLFDASVRLQRVRDAGLCGHAGDVRRARRSAQRAPVAAGTGADLTWRSVGAGADHPASSRTR